jgi:pyruvate ferredoxin oxidoreductase beta subunit
MSDAKPKPKKAPFMNYLSCGHRGCAGCAEATGVRMVLDASGPNTIVTCVTGCLEVMTTGWPETAWKVPFIHAAFENSAAVASGIDAALKALGKREGINILAFGGDGGTFDIGLQAISGMLERGHNVTYVCFDNEAYMNTGIQRSSSTPLGASTTTSPAGIVILGEQRPKKPFAAICAAHDIPYTATANVAYPGDLKRKVKKALEVDGPSVLHIYVPCPTGWRYPSEKSIEMARLSVETGVFILWELEGGDFSKLNVTKKLKDRKPGTEFWKPQGRFGHLFKYRDAEDEKKKKDLLVRMQAEIDEKCERYGVDMDRELDRFVPTS